jgi:hypothetical protein
MSAVRELAAALLLACPLIIVAAVVSICSPRAGLAESVLASQLVTVLVRFFPMAGARTSGRRVWVLVFVQVGGRQPQ